MIVNLAQATSSLLVFWFCLGRCRSYCRFHVLDPLLIPLQADNLKDQCALLYECIRGHIITLRGCKTGSKVIWLL